MSDNFNMIDENPLLIVHAQKMDDMIGNNFAMTPSRITLHVPCGICDNHNPILPL